MLHQLLNQDNQLNKVQPQQLLLLLQPLLHQHLPLLLLLMPLSQLLKINLKRKLLLNQKSQKKNQSLHP